MKFEEIQKLWTSDCPIDETELAQESVKIPQLHNKYLIFYILYKNCTISTVEVL